MSERLVKPEKPKFTVTEEEAINDPECRLKYTHERITAANYGYQVWEIRDFGDCESNPDWMFTHDYYSGRDHKGYIEGNDSVGWDIHAAGLDSDEEEAWYKTNIEPVELLSDAKKRLRDTVAETTLETDS